MRRGVAVAFAAGLVAAAPGIAAAETEADSSPSTAADAASAEPAPEPASTSPEDSAAEDSDDPAPQEPEDVDPADEEEELPAEADVDLDEGPEPDTSSRRSSQHSSDEPETDEPETDETSEAAATEDAATEDDEPTGTAETETETPQSELTPDIDTLAVPDTITAVLDEPAPTTVRRPVNVASMVTDALTWVGLGHLSKDLPIPALPVPRLLEMMWVGLRQTQNAWNNQRPTASPTVSLGDDGVVRGDLNAVDFDDTNLTYTVVTPARFGTVTIAADGTFTYTPRPGLTGISDRFTITIDDAAGNPPRIHGLGELLGLNGPTSATISVDVASTTNISSTAVTRPDAVTVQMDTSGRISVIDGTFTDAQVRDAADAAQFLNTFAPVLGAQSGFATADLITVQRFSAATGATEEYYRLHPSVDGLEVLGSEIVLVTDGAGTVTGLFNYYNTGLADVDTTAELADSSAAATLAAVRLLKSAGLQPTDTAVARVLRSTTVETELVILALDRDVAPTLTWRVSLLPTASAGQAAAGAIYYVNANGADVGTVTAGASSVQAASTIARDALGVSRQINVEAAKWWYFFDSTKLVDTTRKISTYVTTFGLFGLGMPQTPGAIVIRSPLWGWNASAISAHANVAASYDYYLAVLARQGLDGDGGTVVTTVGYNPRDSIWTYFGGYVNAFWDPVGQQIGFGDSGRFSAALDIVAHEYTHGVISHIVANGNSVLDRGESGALNEAYADIMGVLVEGKTGAGRWLIGEDTGIGAIRSLANPTAVGTGYVAHWNQRYTGTQDDGGEHWNSTIFSHAAYLMMTDSRTATVSDDLWATVFYESMYGLGAGAKFVDGRAAILEAADPYFSDAELQAVADAFDAVGIVGAAQTFGAEVLIIAV
ncbi:M4 family metallopeptidase [Mycobacterium sp. MS1601]|uniref:M4 family metallopeptidase n=1 Tax=Mycobacterium sp. MS1601 TaxID=1936029 RepID=UPI0009F99726|nr:M4 family metallopeptidase [Mycobacterium sp. MS1601]